MDMPSSEPLQDSATVAKLLDCERKTLEAWRSRGLGPAYIRVGRLVKYAPKDVRDYILSRRATSTSNAPKD